MKMSNRVALCVSVGHVDLREEGLVGDKLKEEGTLHMQGWASVIGWRCSSDIASTMFNPSRSTKILFLQQDCPKS